MVKIHSEDLPQDFDPVHPRHDQIKHNDIGVFLAIQFKPLPSILSEEHFIAQMLELHAGERSNVGFIINHQNLCHGIPPGINGIGDYTPT
jgi:hypothetical protein